jgi:hypothetical protein
MKSLDLKLKGHTQQPETVERQEDDRRERAYPRNVREHEKAHGANEFSTAVDEPTVDDAPHRDLMCVLGRREDGASKDAPESA